MSEKDNLSESQDMIEEMAEGLYAPCDSGIRFPTGWATLQIDMALMSKEDREKVYQAERLLQEAGITFDTGSGSGYRDWELDWSLTGAFLKIRPFYCMGCHGAQSISRPYWAIYRNSEGHCVSYVYCSQKCRQKDVQTKLDEYSWQLIFGAREMRAWGAGQ